MHLSDSSSLLVGIGIVMVVLLGFQSGSASTGGGAVVGELNPPMGSNLQQRVYRTRGVWAQRAEDSIQQHIGMNEVASFNGGQPGPVHVTTALLDHLYSQ